MSFRKPKDTLEFLEYCHALGAGGIQAELSSTEPDYLKKLRAASEQYGMYLEVMASLPGKDDGAQFERVAAAAREAGARMPPFGLPGRPALRNVFCIAGMADIRHRQPCGD